MPDPRIAAIRDSLSTHIHGKPSAIDSVITCLIAGGHVLIEDVPGVGKTTLAYALSRSMNCLFNRIQFTSDLIPSDIIGVSIYQKPESRFVFHPGPIFANVVLADEINRSSPKSQSALLEAMERGLVTVDGESHPIETPFMVIATQNPVDFESTFPLPSAQLDRFLMRISMGYPDAASEKAMLKSGALHYDDIKIQPVVEKSDIEDLRELAREIFIEDSTYDYLHEIVMRTRKHPGVAVGVSPRGTLAFKSAIQASALVDGRDFVTPEDILRLAVPCLAHRLRLQERHGFEQDWNAAAEIVEEITESVAQPHQVD
ncbi:AAA family ATPase [Pelagicoccus albus]|uniref:MoxR family ATPase n=1 Tax=Pelagicoccus albus TaxID=415222 RepID=A0A7X1B923_9BACT|nr:MoxR family ATPase [Pelagicoccus albus]MBC2606628.1 MoxR family ATPase [Pelagicoccus albus]